ncbi:MAG: hypothetical protein ACLFVK_07285 [Dehalococcoidia bacterium]
MEIHDTFSEQYKDCLDGVYDCVDRVVVNAHFTFAQSPGGFRTWWRILMGNDDQLDNARVMRFAGRFSRRIRAYAQKEGIPLIRCKQLERKHELAEEYIPEDPGFCGLFCILVSRAPGSVFDIRRFSNGAIRIEKKTPPSYVNLYYFHIMDPEWGHVTIRFCPHPPFNAQIILNGHEYVAIAARKQNIGFVKEGNCFTQVSDAAGLARVADAMIRPSGETDEGRLVQVCERWIYSTCLCFALDLAEQERTGFRYSYSVYQAEYSRNLLFESGHIMDQVFESVIDRTRAALDIKTVKTIFGRKDRPHRKGANGKGPRFEVAVERPDYNLTVLRVHFGKLTVRIYSKGERVLRIEVVAHNTRALGCGKVIERFPRIIESLKVIVERCLSVLRSVDVSFIDAGTMEAWPQPSQLGSSRIGGIDINQPRMRAVMEAVIALSMNPRGFTASELAAKVKEIIPGIDYQPRQASYDLKKLRAKGLVRRTDHSRRYQATTDGLRSITAFTTLWDKVLLPLLANPGNSHTGPKPSNPYDIDTHYRNIQMEMYKIFTHFNIGVTSTTFCR